MERRPSRNFVCRKKPCRCGELNPEKCVVVVHIYLKHPWGIPFFLFSLPFRGLAGVMECALKPFKTVIDERSISPQECWDFYITGLCSRKSQHKFKLVLHDQNTTDIEPAKVCQGILLARTFSKPNAGINGDESIIVHMHILLSTL